ncbi:MAG: isoprenyl transferase [Bacillota bacterium]
MSYNIDPNRLPKHIAIIMDGNGRWATKKLLPRIMGHKAGLDSLREIVRECSNLGIKILTVYAFSTENWNRPSEEVSFLMKLLVEYMRKEAEELHKNQVKIKILGDLTPLPEATRREIYDAAELTKQNEGLQFNIALNYGGRAEIIRACRQLLSDALKNGMKPEDIDEALFETHLYTAGDSDPDLIIRTSGEQRLSNFLLWQSAYSELVFPERLWPDFSKEDLQAAIYQYQSRDRRFGALK